MTGHFPPRPGGVQRFTSELLRRLPASDVTVLARDAVGSRIVDDRLPYPVERFRGHVATQPRFGRRLQSLVRSGGYESVWFTSGIPLAAAAGAARSAGARRIVVSTHGLEAGWAGLPAVRDAIRTRSRAADVVTVLGDHTGQRISAALDDGVAVHRLHGGVDCERFRPDVDPSEVQALHRLTDRPTVVTVGRLVPRKGHDLLLRAWPAVIRRHPDAVAVLVGDGSHKLRLRRLAARLGVARHVVFAGNVADRLLPAYFTQASAYALPCRTMAGGLAIEGLGLTTLEAAASGLPVVVGDSGGARDSLLPGKTGYLVDTSRQAPEPTVSALAERIVHLLDHPAQARAMGQAGRDWVEARWTWDRMAGRLAALLSC